MTPIYGASRLYGDLLALGHQVELITSPQGNPFVVFGAYEIELGRFSGRVIGLGVHATADFPRTVSSAIHVRTQPQLYELTDSISNVRNIQPSELGAEWRYWSHNFGWSGERSARRLMSQINQIFKDA